MAETISGTTQWVDMDTAVMVEDEPHYDETLAPVTTQEIDRVWRLFLRKLARKHPEHLWAKVEPGTEGSVVSDAAGPSS